MQRIRLVAAVTAGLFVAVPVMAQTATPPAATGLVSAKMNGAPMKGLQTKLEQQGFSPGAIDGLWGPDTAAALQRFQTARNLPVSGQLDQATMTALDAAPPAPVAAVPATPVAAPAAIANTTPTPTPTPAPSATTTDATTPPATDATSTSTSTSMTGTTATGTNAAAASGNNNQAIATTSANAPQPAHGANSFTKGEAEGRIAGRGFQNVAELKLDGTGVWRGTATKGGQHVGVWLDYKGNVGQQ